VKREPRNKGWGELGISNARLIMGRGLAVARDSLGITEKVYVMRARVKERGTDKGRGGAGGDEVGRSQWNTRYLAE
jgi:hypothetical protein